jgi:hypothetical protein
MTIMKSYEPREIFLNKNESKEIRLGLVLGSPVQSSLLSKFDKTGTGTGLHRLKNYKKLD